MNNFRLTTNKNYNGNLVITQKEIDSVFFLPAPYECYGPLRLQSGTYSLVSRPLFILKSENNSNSLNDDFKIENKNFKNMNSLAQYLSLDRKVIIDCLKKGQTVKGFTII